VDFKVNPNYPLRSARLGRGGFVRAGVSGIF
jgi:hypothetical protein